MLTQGVNGSFSTQLHTLSEMGFNNRQANIEGKLFTYMVHLKLIENKLRETFSAQDFLHVVFFRY